jgi:hypothetical protein
MPLSGTSWVRGRSPARRTVDSPADGEAQRWHPAWFVLVTLGAIACVLVIVLPERSVAWLIDYEGVAIAALVVFAIAGLRMPPGARAIWWALWAFQVLTFTGEAVYDAQHDDSAPTSIPRSRPPCTSVPTSPRSSP